MVRGTGKSEASVTTECAPGTTGSIVPYPTGIVEGTKFTGGEEQYISGVVDGMSVSSGLSETADDSKIQSWVALCTTKSKTGSKVLMVSPLELVSVVQESKEGRRCCSNSCKLSALGSKSAKLSTLIVAKRDCRSEESNKSIKSNSSSREVRSRWSSDKTEGP